MSMEDINDKIDRYVTGRMDAGESAQFEAMMAADAELAARVGEMKEIQETIAGVTPKIRMMKEWDAAPAASRPAPRRWAKVRKVAWGVSVAACLAVIAGSGYMMTLGDSMVAGAGAESVFGGETSTAFRGGSNDMAEIDGLLEQGRTGEALAKIDAAMADTVDLDGADDEEIAYQRELNDYYRYQLSWQRINTLLAHGDTAKAADELRQFVTIDGDLHDQAVRLLRNLDR